MTTSSSCRLVLCVLVIGFFYIPIDAACTYIDHPSKEPSNDRSLMTQDSAVTLDQCKGKCDINAQCVGGVSFVEEEAICFLLLEPLNGFFEFENDLFITSNKSCTQVVPNTPSVSVSGAIVDGSTFTLTCTTASTLSGSATYVWSVGGTDRAASASATMQVTADIRNIGTYTCKVSDNGVDYSSRSSPYQPTVKPATPTISGPTTTVWSGFTVTLTCSSTSAASGSNTMTYTWTKDSSVKSGQTASQLVLDPASPSDAGAYTCSVTYLGATSALSAQLSLAVQDASTMTATVNADVQTAAQLTVDMQPRETQCNQACQIIAQCTAVTFDSSACILHTTNDVTQTPRAGYTFTVKCSDNPNECCLSQHQTATYGSSSTSLTLTDSTDSCGKLCLVISTCAAAVYTTGRMCKVYTSAPVSSDQIGFNFYKKSSTGSGVSATLDATPCTGSMVSRPEHHLLFVLCTLALFSSMTIR